MIAAAVLTVAFLSCGTDHEGLPTSFEFTPPPVPVDVAASGLPGETLVTWGYGDPGIVGEYRVYYYYEDYGMIELVGTTTETLYHDEGLVPNVEYCYVVSAVDSNGLEGYRSETACATPTID